MPQEQANPLLTDKQEKGEMDVTEIESMILKWPQGNDILNELKTTTDSGASKLAQALRNRRIHTVGLSHNNIGNSGVGELIHALYSGITNLYLRGNDIDRGTRYFLKKQFPKIDFGFGN